MKILVLDLLKPHKPNLSEFAEEFCKRIKVKKLELSVYAVDEKTESVKATIEGSNNFEKIKAAIESLGAVVHSVDKIIIEK